MQRSRQFKHSTEINTYQKTSEFIQVYQVTLYPPQKLRANYEFLMTILVLTLKYRSKG